MLTAFSLLGHWLEMRSRFAAGRAVEALLKLAPPTARRGRNGQEEEVPLEAITVGDILAVRPGDTIPRSEEHTSELQSRLHLVCRLLLEKKKSLFGGYAPATRRDQPRPRHR